MSVYVCILHVYAHIYNYMYVYSSIHMYMYVYVCICMYNSEMDCKMPKYKKQYMQVYSCICMYMYVNICICMNMQLYVWVCLRTHLTRHFFSVSGLVSNWCAHWTWKLAGGGHDSCLRLEESCQSWAARGWAKERCQQADLRHTPSVRWLRLSSITVQQKPNSGGEALLRLETSSWLTAAHCSTSTPGPWFGPSITRLPSQLINKHSGFSFLTLCSWNNCNFCFRTVDSSLFP